MAKASEFMALCIDIVPRWLYTHRNVYIANNVDFVYIVDKLRRGTIRNGQGVVLMSVKEITLSARVSVELGAQVDMLAHALKRNRSWVLEEAVRSYLSREMQYLAAIQAGKDAYNAGNVVSHDDVEAMLDLNS